MSSNTLVGNAVEMYAADKPDGKPLATFDSIGKAGRRFGIMRGFQTTVYSRKVIEVQWHSEPKKKVFFKEVV